MSRYFGRQWLNLPGFAKSVKQAIIIVLFYVLTSWIVSSKPIQNTNTQGRASALQYNTTIRDLEDIYVNMALGYFSRSGDQYLDDTGFKADRMEVAEAFSGQADNSDHPDRETEEIDPSMLSDHPGRETEEFDPSMLKSPKNENPMGRIRDRRSANQEGPYMVQDLMLPNILLDYWPSIILSLNKSSVGVWPFPNIQSCDKSCRKPYLNLRDCKKAIIKLVKYRSSGKEFGGLKCLLPGVQSRDSTVLDTSRSSRRLHTLSMFKKSKPNALAKRSQMIELLVQDLDQDYVDQERPCAEIDLSSSLGPELKEVITENQLSSLYTRKTTSNGKIIAVGVTQKVIDHILIKASDSEIGDSFFYKIDDSAAIESESCITSVCGRCIITTQVDFIGKCNVTVNNDVAGRIKLCSTEILPSKILYVIQDTLASMQSESDIASEASNSIMQKAKDVLHKMTPSLHHSLKSGDISRAYTAGLLGSNECAVHDLYRNAQGSTDAVVKCGEIMVPIKASLTSDNVCHVKYHNGFLVHVCRLWPIYRYAICALLTCLFVYVSFKLGILYLVCIFLSTIVAGPAYIVFRFTPNIFRCTKCCYPWSPCHQCPDICICGHFFDKNVPHDCPLNALRLTMSDPRQTVILNKDDYMWDSTGLLQEDGTYSSDNTVYNPNALTPMVTADDTTSLEDSPRKSTDPLGVVEFTEWIRQNRRRMKDLQSRQTAVAPGSKFKPYFFYHTFASIKNPYTKGLTTFLYYLLSLYVISRLVPVVVACPEIEVARVSCTNSCIWDGSSYATISGDQCNCQYVLSCTDNRTRVTATSKDSTRIMDKSTVMEAEGCPVELPMKVKEITEVGILDRCQKNVLFLDSILEQFQLTQLEFSMKVKDCLIGYTMSQLATILKSADELFESNIILMLMSPSRKLGVKQSHVVSDTDIEAKKDMAYINPLADSLRSIKYELGPMSNTDSVNTIKDFSFTYDYLYFITTQSDASIVNFELGATLNNAVRFHPILDGSETSYTVDIWIPDIAYVYQTIYQYSTCSTSNIESTSYSKCWENCDHCLQDAYTASSSSVRVAKDSGTGYAEISWPDAQKTGCNGGGCAGTTGSGCVCALCTNILNREDCGNVYSLSPLYLYATVCIKAADLETVCTTVRPGYPISTPKLHIALESQETDSLNTLSRVVEFDHDPQIYFGNIVQKGSKDLMFGHPQLTKDRDYLFSVPDPKASYVCFTWFDQAVTVDKCLLDTFSQKTDLEPLHHSKIDEANSLLYKSSIKAGILKLQFKLDADDIKVLTKEPSVTIKPAKCSGCCACMGGVQCEFPISSDSSSIISIDCSSVTCSPPSLSISKGEHFYNFTVLTNDCNMIGTTIDVTLYSSKKNVLASTKVSLPKMTNGVAIFESRIHAQKASSGHVPSFFKGFSLPEFFGNFGHRILVYLFSTVAIIILLIILVALARYLYQVTLSHVRREKKNK